MNKNELIAAVAAKTGMPKGTTAVALGAMLSTITEELVAGGEIKLVGFGTLGIKHREEAVRMNPRTKEKVVVPARNTVQFHASKVLKEQVANSK